MLQIRPFIEEDAKEIVKWIKTEDDYYSWCLCYFGPFPLKADMISSYYEKQKNTNIVFPLCLIDNDQVVGQCILRFIDTEKRKMRIGFVIVDDTKRKMGYGKQLMLKACQYAFDVFEASSVELGVFKDNINAYHCYKSVGFVEKEKIEVYKKENDELECFVMEMKRK